MFNDILILFLMFIIYSIIGYIVEVFYSYLETKEFTLNRGFLLGPYIPIFGVGAIAITIFLTKYKNDILILFVIGAVLSALLEYITSVILEKIFKLRWWDYSKYKYNINGRICLEVASLFGIGAVVVVKLFNPIFYKMLLLMPEHYITMISILLFVIFLTDLIITVIIMSKIKINFTKYIKLDATSAIKKEIIKSLRKNISLVNRVFNAFPNIRYIAANKTIKKLPRIRFESDKLKAFKKLIYKTAQEVKKKAKR